MVVFAAGVKVTFDVSRPAGQRVVKALVRCGKCLIPQYSAVDPNELYGIVISGFLANGGDGFSMFANNEYSETLREYTAVQLFPTHHSTDITAATTCCLDLPEKREKMSC